MLGYAWNAPQPLDARIGEHLGFAMATQFTRMRLGNFILGVFLFQ